MELVSETTFYDVTVINYIAVLCCSAAVKERVKLSNSLHLILQISAKVCAIFELTLLSPIQLHCSRALLIDNSDITECGCRY